MPVAARLWITWSLSYNIEEGVEGVKDYNVEIAVEASKLVDERQSQRVTVVGGLVAAVGKLLENVLPITLGN